ncbi:MAG: NAD(P)H-dependent oxidoreductase subunit E [Clostridia bacterium]|nr:NAD(P)H-dependent oxidoreductase subunit E [Clostridia bacterium]
MEKKTLPFNGTKEQEEQLMAVIAEHKDQDGAVIPVLHKAQEIYGYLPIEVQEMISEGLDVPLAEIYGIVTFYTQFSLNPKGKYHIGVCLGTACYVKGSGDILEKIKEILGIEVGECTPDGLFSIEATRCIGACGLAPVLTVNDDVYGRLVVDDVEGIIKKYQEL